MVSTTFATALLSALALTTAAPTARDSTACPKSSQFSLALKAANYPVLSLTAEHSSAGTSSLNFERPSAYPGTPLCISDSRLVFALPGTDEPASAVFAYTGDSYGAKSAITANSGLGGNTGFSIVDGQLAVTKTAALQSFYACNTTVNAVEAFALFYGTQNSDGSAPEGCVIAELVQNFNVEGGATAPSS